MSPTGDAKPGDAKADIVRDEFDKNQRLREDALLRRDLRVEMRSDPDQEENSAVIDQRALEAQRRQESSPPSGYAKIGVVLIRAVKGWPQALFGLGLLFFLWAVGRGRGWW
jgi:hypothetical protein